MDSIANNSNINSSISAIDSMGTTTNKSYYVYEDNDCEIVSRSNRFTFIQKRKNDITRVIARSIEKYNDGRLTFYKCEYLDDFLMKYKERKLSIDVVSRFARCLTEQSDMLNEKNKAIFCITLDCIVVINGRFPVFIDSNFITDIKKDNVVFSAARHATNGEMFSGMFNRLNRTSFSTKIHKLFIAPEIVASYNQETATHKKHEKAYSKLDAESDLFIDKDTCNFAFGVLFVYLLFGFKKYKHFSDIYDVSNKALKPIENTRIYYFITRCLDSKPEQRALLFI